jgi:hypothetical protein
MELVEVRLCGRGCAVEAMKSGPRLYWLATTLRLRNDGRAQLGPSRMIRVGSARRADLLRRSLPVGKPSRAASEMML